MFILPWYRSRKSEVDDDKDEKDSSDYVAPAHFCWMCDACLLSSQCKCSVCSVVKTNLNSVVAKSKINERELKRFGEGNELAN